MHSLIHSLNKRFKFNNQALATQWRYSCEQSKSLLLSSCKAYILEEGQTINNEIYFKMCISEQGVNKGKEGRGQREAGGTTWGG